MKKKFLGDILIYFVAPIILYSLFRGQDKIYSVIITTILAIVYSILIKYNQYRFNLSGILFVSIYTITQALKISLTENYHIYIYDTYCLLILSISIIIANLFDKNIFKLLYADILKILNYTQIQIENTIKKNNLYKDFYKITALANIHILMVTLIRSHALLSLGKSGYLNNFVMEIFISTIFIVVETVVLVIFAKKIKNILKGGKIKNLKFASPESRVINFDKYKNLNK